MKKYAIIVLALALIFLSYFAFAQWNKLYFSTLGDLMFEQKNNLEVVVLNSGIKPETSGALVPLNATAVEGEVKEVVVEYTIMLHHRVKTPKELKVNVSNITVNSKPNPADVVNIKVLAPNTIYNSAITAQLCISIDTQNLSQTDYYSVMNEIQNGHINYNVKFAAF